MKLYLKGDYTKRVPYGYLELAGRGTKTLFTY